MSISYAVFCLNAPAPTDIYTLSLHDALPIFTYWAQSTGGAVQSAEAFPWMLRLANVPVAYVTYISKTFWPAGLAVLYPYPHAIPVLKSLGARSEEHTSELQSHVNLVCRLLLECSGSHRYLHSFPTRRSSDLYLLGAEHRWCGAIRRSISVDAPARKRAGGVRHIHLQDVLAGGLGSALSVSACHSGAEKPRR